MATKLLTVRKTKWKNQFKPDVIRGLPLNPNAAVEDRYYARLIRLINEMTADVERQLKKLFNSETGNQYFAQDKSIAAQAKILTNALTEKYNDLFATNSKPIAETVANQVDASSSTSLHMSIQQLSGGLSLSTSALNGKLTEILEASVTSNVALIKSISQKYLAGVQDAVMRSITTGNGLQDLIPYLANQKGITLRRARMISMDQTRKAYSGLNKGRMQSLGIEKYEWLHSGGSNHPRKLHQQMSGNIYSFDDPPIIDEKTQERGIPGQLPNCRCRMQPIIEFSK